MRIIDQMNREISLSSIPQKVISIVPSQTELLYDLGFPPIAQTVFCVYPENTFKKAVKIGGTKKLLLEKIKALEPDLIIGNKEENDKEQIMELEKEFPLWMSDIHTLSDAQEMISSVGALLDREQKASEINKSITDSLYRPQKSMDALYLIWKDPLMLAGRNTFINEMMEYAGFRNMIRDSESRYPQLSEADLIDFNPPSLLLSSEPYPFGEKHKAYFQSVLPKAQILLVDATYFSWYGSRLQYAMNYFQSLIK